MEVVGWFFSLLFFFLGGRGGGEVTRAEEMMQNWAMAIAPFRQTQSFSKHHWHSQ